MVLLMSRLQRGAVPLHQTLLCSQAMQTVSEQPLLLQVRSPRLLKMSPMAWPNDDLDDGTNNVTSPD